METREFYRRMRKLAAAMGQAFVVVCSKETTDGGREGVLSQVSRETAARLILKDLAALATADQSADYFAEDERRRAVYETEQARNRLHVALANNFTSQIVMGAISPAVPPTGAAGKTNSETEAADTAKKIDG